MEVLACEDDPQLGTGPFVVGTIDHFPINSTTKLARAHRDFHAAGLYKSGKELGELLQMGVQPGAQISTSPQFPGVAILTNQRTGAVSMHNLPQQHEPQGSTVKLTHTDENGNKVEQVYQRQGNQLIPLQVQGQNGQPGQPAQSTTAPKPKSLNPAEDAQIKGMGDLLAALPALRSNIEATGAAGVGLVNRLVAEHTPFGAPQARAMEGSIEQARAALSRATAGGVRLAHSYNDLLTTLPTMTESEDMNRERQAQTELKAQRNAVTLYENLKAQGKDTSTVEQLLREYNISPDDVHQVSRARAGLLSNPGSLSDTDVINMYGNHTFAPDGHFALPRQEAVAVMRQMQARGLFDRLPDWAQKAGINPAQLPDQDALQRNFGKELARPLGPQETPIGSQSQTQTDRQQQSSPDAPQTQEAGMAPGAQGNGGQGPLPPNIPHNSRGQPYSPESSGGVPAGTPAAGQRITPAQAAAANAQDPNAGQHLPVMPTDAVFGPGKVAPPGAGRPTPLTPPTGQSLDETEQQQPPLPRPVLRGSIPLTPVQ